MRPSLFWDVTSYRLVVGYRCCPETPVTKYRATMCNIPEQLWFSMSWTLQKLIKAAKCLTFKESSSYTKQKHFLTDSTVKNVHIRYTYSLQRPIVNSSHFQKSCIIQIHAHVLMHTHTFHSSDEYLNAMSGSQFKEGFCFYMSRCCHNTAYS